MSLLFGSESRLQGSSSINGADLLQSREAASQ
ncbi:hypothetical protein AZE42_11332, partial [Rhizopogon vesiculosus]